MNQTINPVSMPASLAPPEPNEVDPVVTLVESGAAAYVPEDEVPAPISANDSMDKFAEAEKLGFFDETVGMAQIDAPVGRFFGRIHVDESGIRYYEFCFPLNGGGHTPIISVRQGELLLAVKSDFDTEGILVPALKSRLRSFVTKVTLAVLDRWTGEELFDVQAVLRLLVKVSGQLPVISDVDPMNDRLQFYELLDDALNGREPFTFWSPAKNDHKSFYTLSTDEMAFVAAQFKMTAAGFVKKLDNFGFLFRQPSSAGYQCKIRIFADDEAKKLGLDSPFENMYCIWKFDYIGQQKRLSSAKKP